MSIPDLDHRSLRSALEFAVLMAKEGQKCKPPIAHPKGLQRFFASGRLTTPALATVRRLIERDDGFRRRLAEGAIPELVDEIGRLWLARPDGWEREIEQLITEAEAEAEAADASRLLKKAEKRRQAAEQVAARSRAEIVVLSDQLTSRDAAIDGLRADVAKLSDELAEARAELIDARVEIRHARDREAAAVRRLDVAEATRDQALAAQNVAEHVRDDALADRASVTAERSELARLAAAAASLAEQLTSAAEPPPSGRQRPVERRALPMPGGVVGDSDTAAEFLLRSGATVLVDGYNVAKLAWPGLDLAAQRAALVDAVENLTRRYGSDITIVFDGADVVGANADRRRVVRVVFSPEGVTADDVIRDEVRRLPVNRPVVVVTNDREIIGDCRAMGANTMRSDQLIGLLR